MMSLGQKVIALTILLGFVALTFLVGGLLGLVLGLFATTPVAFAIVWKL